MCIMQQFAAIENDSLICLMVFTNSAFTVPIHATLTRQILSIEKNLWAKLSTLLESKKKESFGPLVLDHKSSAFI